MLKVIKKVGNARLCDFETVHGTIHTPAFMNVATAGAVFLPLILKISKHRLCCATHTTFT
jgi:tRNA-guanine family transglycosylase